MYIFNDASLAIIIKKETLAALWLSFRSQQFEIISMVNNTSH